MLKEYSELLPAPDHEHAARFVAKVKDISEFLVALGPVAPEHPVPLKVAYHDACHLCHAQQIRSQPRQLLAMIPGLELLPLEESELCCGAAGTYNLTEPEMSERLGRRKMDHIEATGASVVAAGNVGCILQIARKIKERKSPIEVVHPVDLLDRAYRGGGSRRQEHRRIMSTTVTKPPTRATSPLAGETRILVPRVSWKLYEAFVELLPESSAIRTAFNGKDMEIMVKGPVHNDFARLLDLFVMAVAGELGIRIKPQGETTWKRPEIERGIESDKCYYLEPAKISAALAAMSRGSNDV